MKEMESRRASGLDGFPEECLKKRDMAVLEWQVRLNVSSDMGIVPIWTGMVHV